MRSVIDFDQPVALMLVAVLHFLQDEDKPETVLKTLLDALPSGSYLAASHVTLSMSRKGRRRAARLPRGRNTDADPGRGRVRVARVLRP